MTPPVTLTRYQPPVLSELKAFLDEFDLPLYDILRYHLGWINKQGQPQPEPGSKLLRPSFCLISCEIVGGDWSKILPAAASLELIHNFSLIHDDIEDRSYQRHHRTTVWKLWGLAQGLNSGDAMHCLSQLAMFRLKQNGVSPVKILTALELLDKACLHLCEGQYLDLSFTRQDAISIKNYLDMIELKTAALFKCSFKTGAILGGAGEKVIRQLSDFGQKLGLSFQVRDDYLGIWGKNTGKSVKSDILEKKKSFPVVFALNNASSKNRQKLIDTNKKPRLTGDDVFEVTRILEDCGAREQTEKLSLEYCREAIARIRNIPLPEESKKQLVEVASYLAEREY